MQHMKITDNLGEFQKFLDSDNKTGLCLEDTIRFFDIQRIFGQFESIKQNGLRVTMIMTSLLVMLFYRNKSIHSYFSRQFGKQAVREGSKNPYYDLLGNEKISWRTILYLFAKRYLNLSSRITELSDNIRALIFDDSPIEKSGKKIEGVSKMHDHVTGRFLFGYKLLVCGYWDGGNFIPVDFSLHRERGNGLDKARDKRNRAKKKAKQAEAAYQEHRRQHQERRTVLNSLRDEMRSCSKKAIALECEKHEKRVSRSKKKQSRLLGKMKMISRAVKRGLVFDYILFDSWFFSKEILAHIESFRTKGIKLIAMVKMGKTKYRDCLSGMDMDAPTLRKRYQNKGRKTRSRKYNAQYIKVPVWYDNRRVNLFFVKLGSGGKWKAFITNDLEIGFNKLMETYHIRWSIEVFFKDAKQHLQLGKCQCNNFDSQMHYGNSLGSIFDLLSSQAEEGNVTRYLLDIFWEIVNGIGEILKVDCMELIEDIIRDNQRAEEIMRIISPALEKKRAA